MKLQLSLPLVAAALGLTSVLALIPSNVSANNGTNFVCVPQSAGNVATVAQRRGKEPVIIFLWTPEGSRHFGDQYSPQARCQVVSNRLNDAVRNNGGKLSGILMTTGKLERTNQTVICILNQSQTKCDGTNTLFTLKPSNAANAGDVLGQLLQIGRTGSSAGVITETSGESYVDLGIVETSLDQSSNTSTPETVITPNNQDDSPSSITPDDSQGL